MNVFFISIIIVIGSSLAMSSRYCNVFINKDGNNGNLLPDQRSVTLFDWRCSITECLITDLSACFFIKHRKNRMCLRERKHHSVEQGKGMTQVIYDVKN